MKEDCLEDERSIAKNDELWRLGSHNWYIEQSRYIPNQMERVNDVDKKKTEIIQIMMIVSRAV